ncbi:hypothetical protein D3C87_1225320 [compost metagenome]
MQFLGLALLAVLGTSAVFAGKSSAVKTQKAESTYTYYKENECDIAVTCSDEFDGQLCSEYLENSLVYNEPGCQPQHEVAIPLGKRP